MRRLLSVPNRLVVLALSILAVPCYVNAAEIRDLSQINNLNRDHIQQAINEARDYFNDPVRRGQTGLEFEIILPPRWITIGARRGDARANGIGLLVFNDINPGKGNKLILRGTGTEYHDECKCTMSKTTLAFPWDYTNMSGYRTYNVEFRNIHFTKNRLKVTQGHVAGIGPNYLVIRLEQDYPSLSPTEFGGVCRPRNPDVSTPTKCEDIGGHGKKIRKYIEVNDPNSPGGMRPVYQRPLPGIKGGVKWDMAIKHGTHPRDWRIYTSPREHISEFSIEDKVGIKTKHGQHAYYFQTGQNIRFLGVQWTQESRGIFRGVNQVTIENSYAGPDPYLKYRLGRSTNARPVSYLSTSAGGPQIGSPDDFPLNWDARPRNNSVRARSGGSWHVVHRNRFVRLGDDAIGLFNLDKKNYVIRNYVSDGPARSVYQLNQCGNFYNNVTYNQTNTFVNSVVPEIERATENGEPKHSWSPSEITRRCNEWKQSLGL